MPATQPAAVLIVDDDPANLELLFQHLSQAGYRVLVAETGQLALERAELAQPEAILLDVMMPGMDGFETCRRLKQQATTQAIPVIFMTALADTADKVKGFAAGGVDYVTKPFQPEELLARVQAHTTVYLLQKELRRKNSELEVALSQVKRLSGLLPICASCKKIRDDQGYWQDVAVYIQDHSEAELSHGLCADCAKRLYPELYEEDWE
ncbi:MAG TPA: response regulator [Roseiflexaceae bacterium]|nr:response regulator [Roseiflexaceae bacterium]